MIKPFPLLARRFSQLLAAVLLLTMTTRSHAAADSATFTALFFPPSLSAKEPEFFIGELKAREKVSIPITMLGGPFKSTIREGGLLDLFTTDTDERPALTVKLPAGVRERILVVIVPKGDGYLAHALSLPAQGFNGGTMLAMNAAPVEVAIRYGKDSGKPIKPGESTLLAPPANHREPMIPVEIHKRTPGEGWTIEQRVRWPVDTVFKSYLFLYQSPENNRILVRSVPERVAGR